jgi:hypothetical protein
VWIWAHEEVFIIVGSIIIIFGDIRLAGPLVNNPDPNLQLLLPLSECTTLDLLKPTKRCVKPQAGRRPLVL